MIVPSRGALVLLIAGVSEVVTRHVIEHGTETLGELAPSIVEAIERMTYGDPPPYLEGE